MDEIELVKQEYEQLLGRNYRVIKNGSSFTFVKWDKDAYWLEKLLGLAWKDIGITWNIKASPNFDAMQPFVALYDNDEEFKELLDGKVRFSWNIL